MQSLAASMIGLEERERTITELDDIDSLVRAHRARLLRFVTFSVGDADMAATIVQDCFLRAYTKRDQFRGDCAVGTWLTSIAVNLVRDYQRGRKMQFWRKAAKTSIDVFEMAPVLPGHESSPEARIVAREKTAAVSGVLETLSLNQRAVFLMRFSDEMEISEIQLRRACQSTQSRPIFIVPCARYENELEGTMNEHLTDEQFCDVLAEELDDPIAEAHLVQCEACRQEVASVQSATETFNEVTTAWAHAEAPKVVRTPSRVARFLGSRPAWGIGVTATAAVCLVAFGLGLPSGNVHPPESAVVPKADPSMAELAQDNQLMFSIDSKLRSGAQPSFSVTELRLPVRRGQSSSTHRMLR